MEIPTELGRFVVTVVGVGSLVLTQKTQEWLYWVRSNVCVV